MDSTRWNYLSLTFAALSALAGDIDCVRNKDKTPIHPILAERFQDVSRAINYMHKYLPSDMTMDEKCKRYAVLSTKPISEKLPHETVTNVIKMNNDDLDRYYNEIDVRRMIWNYMVAIDRYRVTQLAPPFIDIVECLRRIDTNEVRRYLSNPELLVILDLYKQALGLPDTTIDIRGLNFTKFHHSFRTTIENLFSQSFRTDKISGDTLSDQSNSNDSPYKRSGQLYLRREQARLTQRRLRIMHSEAFKKYQTDQKRSIRSRDKIALSQSGITDDVIEAKRLAQEKRDRINEWRRNRRKQLRQKRIQQRSESTMTQVEQPSASQQRVQHQTDCCQQVHQANGHPTGSLNPSPVEINPVDHAQAGSIIEAAPSTLTSNIDLGGTRNRRPGSIGRFQDITLAINSLHERLPPQLSMDDKCKMYAILSSRVLGRSIGSTVSEVVAMERDALIGYYDAMETREIGRMYMIAIDKYRVTRLAPPIFDILECLEQMELPEVQRYLKNTELKVILDLYKRVLESSDTQIEIDDLDLGEFRPSFRRTIRKLFGQHLSADDFVGDDDMAEPDNPEEEREL